MCLVLIAYKTHPDFPLVIAANRDEFYRRPASPAAFWPDHPHILGGRDLLHGGTWLAVDRQGRLAAVTNYREPAVQNQNQSLKSRGLLVTDYLFSKDTAQDYLDDLAERVREYDGFNLFAGDAVAFFFYGSYLNRSVQLQPGIHGISNGDLDYPWPKVTRGKQALQTLVADSASPDVESLFAILQDRSVPADTELPDTGMGLQMERMLAPVFVTGIDYGTRSSTVLIVNHNGRVDFAERSFGPGGELQNTVEFEFQIDSRMETQRHGRHGNKAEGI